MISINKNKWGASKTKQQTQSLEIIANNKTHMHTNQNDAENTPETMGKQTNNSSQQIIVKTQAHI